MHNNNKPLNIYLMGIGGTGMGAFAGLLKQSGHHVTGSDMVLYSPMKEKLLDWGINYNTPYQETNLNTTTDMVIVGNVIRKDNPEAMAIRARNIPHDSFPSALYKLYLKDAIPIVASGTHGKTTCSALLAHTLNHAGYHPGFLIGGIPLNFNDSFYSPKIAHHPFVVEGDEYDTAYFDKKPKFMHYAPKFLLITAIEFDHGDIYPDLNAVINAFTALLNSLNKDSVVVVLGLDDNITEAINKSHCQAKIYYYGDGCDYYALDTTLNDQGINFVVAYKNNKLGPITLPLFGQHNLANALGVYALLHQYGLSHEEIAKGFASFLGVKRRMEEIYRDNNIIAIDDFAHHPTAVLATIKACKQKYPHQKIYAIFEPKSATSCMKIFEEDYIKSFMIADEVLIAPVGRNLDIDKRIDTKKICTHLSKHGILAKAFDDFLPLKDELKKIKNGILLFMSNGSFNDMLKDLTNILAKPR